MTTAVVIGAGPAGLMAAETLAQAGVSVTVCDAMPSVGRKFLMAGKSGLNLSKSEPMADFLAAYGPLPDPVADAIHAFGPDDVCNWVRDLGQEVFVGSTGRVFPTVMKASPLLRAWIGRMTAAGVRLNTRWRWTGWADDALRFETPEGPQTLRSDITIVATGGASWARLGSDGAWSGWMPSVPFKPANVGFEVSWSDHMTRHFGTPVKGVELHAGNLSSRGEWVVSSRGIEGGGVYMISRTAREGAPIYCDLLPERSENQVRTALARPRGKSSLTNHLRKTLRLDPIRLALLSEFGRPFPADMARIIKSLPITHTGPRQLDEAISTAGGVPFSTLSGFELSERRGVFVAGEALDWEAPTGGYLITACLATGKAAAKQALDQL